jgi:flagellar basal body-associated protein FliL
MVLEGVSAQVAGGAQTALLWLEIIVMMVLVAAIIFGIYWWRTFKHRAAIVDAQRKLSVTFKKFKIDHKKGIIKFWKNGPKKMLIPHNECFLPFQKNKVFFTVIQNGEFFMPLRINPDLEYLESAAAFQAIKLYHISDVKETIETYKKKESLLIQMMPWIAFAFVVIIHFIVMMMLLKKGDTSAAVENVKSVGSQLIPGT